MPKEKNPVKEISQKEAKKMLVDLYDFNNGLISLITRYAPKIDTSLIIGILETHILTINESASKQMEAKSLLKAMKKIKKQDNADRGYIA